MDREKEYRQAVEALKEASQLAEELLGPTNNLPISLDLELAHNGFVVKIVIDPSEP